jgi:hypothetical protein
MAENDGGPIGLVSFVLVLPIVGIFRPFIHRFASHHHVAAFERRVLVLIRSSTALVHSHY